MVEILVLLIVSGLCLFDAFVSINKPLGITYMRHHVPFCEQQNREQAEHHREQWS